MIAVAGPVMAIVQALVVRVEPGIGALCAGAAGIAMVLVVRRMPHGSRPVEHHNALALEPARTTALEPARAAALEPVGVANRERAGVAAAERSELDELTESGDRVAARAADVPYALLAIIALAVFLPPPLRSWAKGNLLLGPSFPSTTTAQGTVNPAVHGYNPIAVMGHPGTFLLLACAASAVVWHLTGVWQRGSWSPIWRGALRQAWKSSPSVVLLASVAGVLVDSGMVRTVARGAAAATGQAYPAKAPLVGALGSFITGSTTSSNALFSALQRDVALLIGARPADLLAGQLAGGNIGNSLAPVVILLGLSAVGAARSAGDVLRMTLLPAGVLLTSAVLTTWTLVAIHH